MFSVDKTPSTPGKSSKKNKSENSPQKQKMGKQKNAQGGMKQKNSPNKNQNGQQAKSGMKRNFDTMNKSSPMKNKGFNKNFQQKLKVSDTIVAKKIPNDVKESDIKKFFSQYGTVKEVENLTEGLANHRPVYKVKFSSVEEATKALKGRELLNGSKVFRSPMNFKAKPTTLEHAVHISNLPEYNNDLLIKQFFSKCGQIRSVKLIKNPGEERFSSGYVHFFDDAVLEKALKLNGKEFNGKNIAISKVSEDEKQQGKKKQKQSQQAKKAAVKATEDDENDEDDSDDEGGMEVEEEEDDDDNDDDDDDDDDEEEDNEEEEEDDDDDDDDDEEDDEEEDDSDDEEEEEEDDEPTPKKAKKNADKKAFAKNMQKKTNVMMKIQKPKIKGKGGKS